MKKGVKSLGSRYLGWGWKGRGVGWYCLQAPVEIRTENFLLTCLKVVQSRLMEMLEWRLLAHSLIF